MFASREDAGRKLANLLRQENVKGDLVLGLPRGGVVVAAEVAHTLDLPLDVIVVRKIGHPLQREFAVGALAEPDIVRLDERILAKNPHIRSDLEYIINEERQRLAAYQERFHHDGFPDLLNKTVIIVDDGLATGATNEAAALSARRQGASRVLIAAPVASANAVDRLARVADSVHVLYVDPEFDAVGRYYDVFDQTSDEEVLDLLRAESRRHA
jgi:predicted phosphoribosyltransferase